MKKKKKLRTVNCFTLGMEIKKSMSQSRYFHAYLLITIHWSAGVKIIIRNASRSISSSLGWCFLPSLAVLNLISLLLCLFLLLLNEDSSKVLPSMIFIAKAIAMQVDAFILLVVQRAQSFAIVCFWTFISCWNLYFHLFCVCLTTDCFTFYIRGYFEEWERERENQARKDFRRDIRFQSVLLHFKRFKSESLIAIAQRFLLKFNFKFLVGWSI